MNINTLGTIMRDIEMLIAAHQTGNITEKDFKLRLKQIIERLIDFKFSLDN